MSLLALVESGAPATHLTARARKKPKEAIAADGTGEVPLHVAVRYSADLCAIAALIAANPAALHCRSTWSLKTPLFLAAATGQADVLQAMLSEPAAEVDCAAAGGATPLWQAAQMGHTECVQILLASGACPTTEVEDGDTPLDVATRNGNEECCALLRGVLARCNSNSKSCNSN
jgi:ankyrin repeat protein